ncbi:autotransporter domain-containing protein [Myxococcus sp. K15C18031901]|uniref:autotransporter domain-containing protein n=1 Tax=Myxococcus dinghuensis TaxID=2906761 RepID=UPI0020A7FF8F|nr:autotransporter domain-containing protein [Myxococcus dinghuensis]MCP3102313.1 autotransporter domain-containing protein [Myxococcus dinghuensis]
MRHATATSAVLLLILLCAAPTAHAESEGLKLTVGARAGYGLPTGLVRGGEGHYDVRLNKVAKGIIPMQIDAGTFLASRIYVGAFFQYAKGLAASECQGECGVSAMRFGLAVSYHHPWSEDLSPWLGVGAGYDILDADQMPSVMTGKLERVDATSKGFELGNVQAGLDFRLAGPVWFGPYVTATLARYKEQDPRDHSWLMGGLRLMVRR